MIRNRKALSLCQCRVTWLLVDSLNFTQIFLLHSLSVSKEDAEPLHPILAKDVFSLVS